MSYGPERGSGPTSTSTHPLRDRPERLSWTELFPSVRVPDEDLPGRANGSTSRTNRTPAHQTILVLCEGTLPSNHRLPVGGDEVGVVESKAVDKEIKRHPTCRRGGYVRKRVREEEETKVTLGGERLTTHIVGLGAQSRASRTPSRPLLPRPLPGLAAVGNVRGAVGVEGLGEEFTPVFYPNGKLSKDEQKGSC